MHRNMTEEDIYELHAEQHQYKIGNTLPLYLKLPAG